MLESSPPNTETMIYALPASSYEIGALIQQIAELDESRAIIVDFLQKTIIVHPTSPEDDAVFTEESLTYVLASEELEMVDSELPWKEALTGVIDENDETFVTFCSHPANKTFISEEKVLWTTLVSKAAILAVSQKSLSTHKMWRIRGVPDFQQNQADTM